MSPAPAPPLGTQALRQAWKAAGGRAAAAAAAVAPPAAPPAYSFSSEQLLAPNMLLSVARFCRALHRHTGRVIVLSVLLLLMLNKQLAKLQADHRPDCNEVRAQLNPAFAQFLPPHGTQRHTGSAAGSVGRPIHTCRRPCMSHPAAAGSACR